MLKSVEGVYKDGAVQIFEKPSEIGESRVIVTFLPAGGRVDLAARGIDEAHAADLRARLRAFADDWDRPEMKAYDFL
ncbi:MAG: hypothetical protein AB1714_31125 [Acidobacteriota bacterium]